jgi:Tfp pilus assembly major pilin PilA
MKRRQDKAARTENIPHVGASPRSMSRNGGFTLVEIMLATVISIMVFVAMGALLTRSFSLWMDAMGNWKLAQHARIARSRMMDGAFYFSAGSNIVVKTGWLSSTNVTRAVASGEAYVQYYPLKATGGAFRVYGWTNAAAGKNLRMQSGSSAWVLGQNVAATNYATDVRVDLFNPVITNGGVLATFRLSFSAMGRTYTQPCTVNAFLINH